MAKLKLFTSDHADSAEQKFAYDISARRYVSWRRPEKVPAPSGGPHTHLIANSIGKSPLR